jgi:hypothetical protein
LLFFKYIIIDMGQSWCGSSQKEIQERNRITMKESIINWRELSRRVSGSSTNISANRIPKKYKEKVDTFVKYVELIADRVL